ncbi:MAG: response regulator [Anaerolineae bacterium]
MSNQDPIRIFIADDHNILREGLVSLLSNVPGLEVVGLASNGSEAVALLRELQPDVAVLDITLGDMSGFEVVRELGSDLTDVNILFLTMHEEESFFFEALRVGASGYFLKGSNSKELITAIQSVHKGGIYLPPKLAGGLVEDFLSFKYRTHEEDSLTPRENEILTMIARGMTNREMAEQLTVSINTVKTHRLRIYQKLDLRDRASLVSYALRRGLLQPSR